MYILTYASISEIQKYLFFFSPTFSRQGGLQWGSKASRKLEPFEASCRGGSRGAAPQGKVSPSPAIGAAANQQREKLAPPLRCSSAARAPARSEKKFGASLGRRDSRRQDLANAAHAVPRHSCTVALPLRAIIRSPTAEGDPPPSLSAVFNRPWQKGNNRKVIWVTSPRVLESGPTENLSHLSSYTRVKLSYFFYVYIVLYREIVYKN